MNMSNSSSTRFECDFTWTLQNFEKDYGDDLDSDEYVANSPEFSSADDTVEWFLELRSDNTYLHHHHRHRHHRHHRNMSFYFGYDKLEKRCRIIGQFEYSFVNSEGQKVNKDPIYFCLHYSKEGYVCVKDFPTCLYSLRKIKCMDNDQLTIYCRVSYVREVEADPVFIDQPDSIKENFEMFLNKEEFSDVAVYVGDMMFPCHKIILATRSSVFKAMFSNNMKENVSNRIDIHDIDGNVFQEALRYIYTGKVEILEETVFELLHVADMYDLTSLKKLCETALGTMLTVKNAVKILSTSNTYDLKYMKAQTMKFIEINLREIIDTDVWNDLALHPDVLKILLKKFVK